MGRLPATFIFIGLLAPSWVMAQVVANDNRVPAGQLNDGVLELHLEARLATWRPELDADYALTVLAFAEPGKQAQIPGPLIRVTVGTEIRLTVRNSVPDRTQIGMPTPKRQRDGLSSIAGTTLTIHGLRAGTVEDDAIQIEAGETREIRFIADKPGSYLYWGSMTDASLVERSGRDSQLTGAIIVDPAGTMPHPDERVFVITHLDVYPDYERERWQGLDMHAPAINGLSWPFTERLRHAVGEPVHWRWLNGSAFDHPMHLHGFHFDILARGDGLNETIFPKDEVPTVVTELAEPGETFRMEWIPTRAGNWMMHCHVIDHIIPTEPRGEESMAHDLHDPVHHAMTAMAGLILGVTVTDEAGEEETPEPYQHLRLIARQHYKGEDLERGFVLKGSAQPTPDAISVPGPPLLLPRNERTVITIVNELTEPTTIHWHGMELESMYDGVAGWSRTGNRIAPLIAPGDSFTVAMTPPRAGSFIYHTHMDETEQQMSGMYGPMLVLEPDEPYDLDQDRLFVFGGSVNGWASLNGSPSPVPATFKAGQTYRLRFINIQGSKMDISLLDGDAPVQWQLHAKDGADVKETLRVLQPASVRLSIGETYDFLWTPAEPGERLLKAYVHYATEPSFEEIFQTMRVE